MVTPTDLVKVRMQAQGKLGPGQTKRYKNTWAAFKEIIDAGGMRALYVGIGPTVKRAAILTATQVKNIKQINKQALNVGTSCVILNHSIEVLYIIYIYILVV